MSVIFGIRFLLTFAVWVDNDKKEKEIAIGKSSTPQKEDLGFWNLAEDRIGSINVVDEFHGNRKKPTTPKYVGNEDTPSLDDNKKPTESAANRDTVDAEVINDEESNDRDDDELPGDSSLALDDQTDEDSPVSSDASKLLKDSYSEEDSENDGHEGTAVADEATSIVDGTSQRIVAEDGDVSDENLSTVNEVGQGKSRVEKPNSKSRRKKTGYRKFSNGKHLIDKTSSKKSSKVKKTSSLTGRRKKVKESAKSVLQKKSKANRVDNSVYSDLDHAKQMLYDGMEIKRDDISKLEPLQFEEGTLRDKLNSYAPDDSDISNIVSRFTDHKHENSHRMGNDELQMHLDDEALKMQVKAIEEEDSNVKNVLQGSERFANEQKLGRFEGDFEKDLIKNIGKDGVDLDSGEPGKHRHEVHREERNFGELDDKAKYDDDENEEENDREGYKGELENKDRDEQDEEEDDERQRPNNSRNKKWNDDDKNDSDGDDNDGDDRGNEDTNGERKNVVRGSSGDGSTKRNYERTMRYKFFTPTGKFGGDVSPSEEAEMGVNIDNQAMESEIKEIENEDARVSSVLEGMNKGPDKIDLDEYKYDSADGSTSAKFNHHKFGEGMTDIENDTQNDQADQKHTVSQNESVKGGSPISDELRDMLRETSKILNETNAVLNEGHAIAQKSHEILNSTNHRNVSEGIEASTISSNNTVRNETNGNKQNSSSWNESVNVTSPTGVDAVNSQANMTNTTENVSKQNAANDSVTASSSNTGVSSSSFTAIDEFLVKELPASKRVLKRNDEYDSKTAQEVRRRPGKTSWRKSGKPRRRHRKQKLKLFFEENKTVTQNPARQKYSKSELNILNLMYKSPALKGVRGKPSRTHFQQADKRSYTPNKKTTYRRYKKPKEMRKKGAFTKKRNPEGGKKRGDVEEGMTGGEYLLQNVHKSFINILCKILEKCYLEYWKKDSLVPNCRTCAV